MKTCKKEGCNYPVFSHLYCKNHQYLRDDKQTRIISPHPQGKPMPSVMAESMLFKMIWDRSNKKSYLTGLWLRDYLNSPMWPSCFAHILPKGQNKYPYFRFYARCICLLTPDEHHLWDDGTEEQRINYSLDVEERSGGKNTADWNKIKALETELLAEYHKYFPSTVGMLIGVRYNIFEVAEIVGKLNKEFFDSIK